MKKSSAESASFFAERASLIVLRFEKAKKCVFLDTDFTDFIEK
jgi:hypothetical protein